jgi:hypothetical protein
VTSKADRVRSSQEVRELVGAHTPANASHELRTPLARIRMAVELMKKAPTAAPRRLERHRQLDALIEEILLASRLDSMQEQAALEQVDLLGLAAEVRRHEEAELDSDRSRSATHGCCADDPQPAAERAQHGAPPIEMRVRNVEAMPRSASATTARECPSRARECSSRFWRAGASVQAAGAGAGPKRGRAPPRGRSVLRQLLLQRLRSRRAQRSAAAAAMGSASSASSAPCASAPRTIASPARCRRRWRPGKRSTRARAPRQELTVVFDLEDRATSCSPLRTVTCRRAACTERVVGDS